MKKIKGILVEEQGWVFSTTEEPIESFLVNGEMAHVTWFRKGKSEYNGKYVIEIVYE